MAVQRKKVGSEAEGYVSVGSLKRLLEQAVDQMAAARKEDAEARRFCHGTRKAVLMRFYYRTVFPDEKAVKYSVSKELAWTPEKMLGREAVWNRVMRFDAEQQSFVACLQSKMGYYEGQSVSLVVLQSSLRKTEVKSISGSSGNGRGGGRPKELKKNCDRKE